MLACIPTRGNQGRDDAVNEHFGSAPYFTLYNSETDQIEIIDNSNVHHDHGNCHPLDQLMRHHIDCVICGGMGRRAIEALGAGNIKVYQSRSSSVQEIIEKIKSNDLVEINPAKACRGHDQVAGVQAKGLGQGRGSDCGQGGCHGQGRGGGHGQGRGGGSRGGRG